MFYFSEKDSSIGLSDKEIISLPLWEGIRTVISKYIDHNHLAKDFPVLCEDGNNQVYSTDRKRLQTALNAVVPNAPMLDAEYRHRGNDILDYELIDDENDELEDDVKRTYIILDTIEFIYSHIYDYKYDKHHEFFDHYHLKFLHNTKWAKDRFVEDINDIFRRNEVIYQLDNNGKIIRPVPIGLKNMIVGSVKTKDENLNDLIKEAILRYQSPKADERQIAIEKLWDALERLKTIEYVENDNYNKRVLADKVIATISDNDQNFIDLLKQEFATLTDIGNNYRIRHHEANKKSIPTSAMMDYLYYRCMCVVRLFLEYYNLGV